MKDTSHSCRTLDIKQISLSARTPRAAFSVNSYPRSKQYDNGITVGWQALIAVVRDASLVSGVTAGVPLAFFRVLGGEMAASS
jgi:hypothetical protein